MIPENELRQLFKNRSDCYADTWMDIGIEMKQGDVVQAMTEDRFIETVNEALRKHGVMQGCQCKDRIGETKVWCCNQCGLPCEDFWLPTHYTVGSRTVGNSAAGQSGSEGALPL